MVSENGRDPMLPVGTNYCKCPACGEYFTTVRGFDKHQRTGPDDRPVCLEPAAVGLVLSKKGYWQRPGRRPLEAFLAAGERLERVEGAVVVLEDIEAVSDSFSACPAGTREHSENRGEAA